MPYEPIEMLPGAEVQSDDELMAAAQRIGTSIFHPAGTPSYVHPYMSYCTLGTCRMSSDDTDTMAVVDARLRLRGDITGLRICDASIMPNITSGNTNTPTLAIAEKGADIILQDHGILCTKP